MTPICVCSQTRTIAPTSKRESPRFNVAPSVSLSVAEPQLVVPAPDAAEPPALPVMAAAVPASRAPMRRRPPSLRETRASSPALRVRGVGHRHAIVGIGRISLGARRQGFRRAAGCRFGNAMEPSLPIRVFRRTVVGNRGGRALHDRRGARGLRRCRGLGRATPDRRGHASRSGSPMGFLKRMLLVLSVGCSFSPQLDGTYVCGVDGSCPPALHCNLDHRCVGDFPPSSLSTAQTCIRLSIRRAPIWL